MKLQKKEGILEHQKIKKNMKNKNISKSGLPWWLSGKGSSCHCSKHRFDP